MNNIVFNLNEESLKIINNNKVIICNYKQLDEICKNKILLDKYLIQGDDLFVKKMDTYEIEIIGKITSIIIK